MVDSMEYLTDIAKTKKERDNMTDYKNTGKRVKAIDDILGQVSFGQILWYEVRKHKFMLSVAYGLAITALYVVNGLPIAIHNVFGR